MADADVRSLERLEQYLEHAKHYKTHLVREVENLQVELRKLTSWIENEALQYWQSELQLSQRRLTEAQDALTRCMSYVREEERKPCSEEKKRVQRAKERCSTCEGKVRIARAAAKAWDRERTKNMGKLQRTYELGDADMSVTIHHLQGQIETLSEYASLRSNAVITNTPKPTGKSQTASAEDTTSKEKI